MIIRECSGGIVFDNDKVLLIKNEKQEWGFPKGVFRHGQKMEEIAVERVKVETGIDAHIIACCGKTNYEFYSIKRKKPIHNNVSWYVMGADTEILKPNVEENIEECAFVEIQKAVKKVTYSQDKSLLMKAYQVYKSH